MLKEYLAAPLGGSVTAVEAVWQSITIANAINGVKVELAYTGPGVYTITSTRNSLNGTVINSPGVVVINGFRTNATPPFSSSTMTITVMPGSDVFGDIVSGDASTGINQYRATCLVGDRLVQSYNRTITDLGIPTTTKDHWLGAGGPGTIGGWFVGWPASGWCRISSGEVVYYASRTDSLLTVPTRARLGTNATVGASGQGLRAVPGALIGTGALVTIADQHTAPAGIAFGQSITIPQLLPAAIGTIWYWREIPASAVCTANMIASYNTTYLEYP